MMSLVHLLLFVGVVTAAASSPGSHLILREIAGQKDKAVELNTTNFDSVLKDTPAKYAVVEFFAYCMLRTLERYQKCNYGAPEPNVPSREALAVELSSQQEYLKLKELYDALQTTQLPKEICWEKVLGL